MSARLSNIANTLGPFGIIGVGVLAAGVSAYFGYITPLTNEVHRLSEISPAQAQSPNAPAKETIATPPGRAARDQTMAALQRSAVEAGVQIVERRMEEAATAAEGLRETRLRAVFEGQYPQLRRWLDDTTRHPNLDWQSLRIDKAGTATDRMRLTIQLNFRWRDQGAEASTERGVTPTPPPQGEVAVNPFTAATSPSPKIAIEPPRDLPEFPYTYAGRYQAAQGEIFLLSQGETSLRLRVGDVLPGGAFRLEGREGEKLIFIHLASQRRIALGPDPGQPQ